MPSVVINAGIIPAKNEKLSPSKDPHFGLAVLVGRIASPSLYVVMLADGHAS